MVVDGVMENDSQIQNEEHEHMTGAKKVIDIEHHEIHEGHHYFLDGSKSFTNAEVFDFTVVTPNSSKWLHMVFQIEGTGGVILEIKEGAATDVAGTVVTPINNDRNSSNTSDSVVRTGDTFTSEGTTLYTQQTGANQKAGAISRNREIILKQNTTYIFRLTNATALANQITYAAEWYEEEFD